MDAITKYARTRKQLAESTNTGTVAAALQRVAEGDDADDVVIDCLYALTHKPGSERLMTDKTLRRLRNVLEHHARTYRAMTDAVRECFTTEIEANGMRLSAQLLSDRCGHGRLRRCGWRLAVLIG